MPVILYSAHQSGMRSAIVKVSGAPHSTLMLTLPFQGKPDWISIFAMPDCSCLSMRTPIYRWTNTVLSVSVNTYDPMELISLARLGGQQAQPNHFWRTGFTCSFWLSLWHASGTTSSGFT